MKQGNQFYLCVQILDKDNNVLDINNISKVRFLFNDLVKEYPSEDVVYDNSNFKIWLTQEETFSMKDSVKLEIRVKFTDDTILGTIVENKTVYPSIDKVII